jgi:RHS repeat-associated protein
VIEELAAGTVTAQNVWSIDFVNDLLLRDDNSVSGNLGISGSGLGERIYAQHDLVYSVTALVSSDGTVLQRAICTAYGQQTVLSKSWATASDAYNWLYYFQGGRLNPATGLIRFNARDYNSLDGTWIEPDPIGYVNGPDQFQFTVSNPVRYTDSLGLTPATQQATPAGTQPAGTQPADPPPPAALAQDVPGLIQQLDDSDSRVRENAQDQLREMLTNDPTFALHNQLADLYNNPVNQLTLSQRSLIGLLIHTLVWASASPQPLQVGQNGVISVVRTDGIGKKPVAFADGEQLIIDIWQNYLEIFTFTDGTAAIGSETDRVTDDGIAKQLSIRLDKLKGDKNFVSLHIKGLKCGTAKMRIWVSTPGQRANPEVDPPYQDLTINVVPAKN